MWIRRLGNKMLLTMVAVILAITVAFLVYIVTYVGGVLEQRTHDEGMTLAQNLAQSSELGVLTGEKRFLKGPFKGVMANPSVVYVAVYDPQGNAIISDSKFDFDAVLPQEVILRMSRSPVAFYLNAPTEEAPNAVDYYAPVMIPPEDLEMEDYIDITEAPSPPAEGLFIGFVRLGVSGADIIRVRNQVLLFGLSVALAVFILTTVVVTILAKRITHPLAQLREGASRVAQGDLDFHIGVRSRDEVGELANSFNQMTRDLRKTTVSRNYLDDILGSMIDTLVVVDKEKIIQSVNPALLELLGYSEKDLIGQPFSKLLGSDEVLSGEEWQKFLRDGVLRDLELDYVTSSGEIIPMSFSGSIMFDAERRAKLMVGVARDMRQIKKLMKETEQARDDAEGEQIRLKSLVSSLSEGVLMLSPEQDVVIANPFARRILRLSRDGAVSMDDIRQVKWLDIDGLLKKSKESASGAAYCEVDVDFPIPQVIRVAVSQLLAVDGRMLGQAVVLHDVTEERQIDQMRDEFIVTVSHDLRSPLTTIKGFIALLLDGKVGELTLKQRQFLENVEEGTQHLHNLINNLLDLSRIKAGKLVVQAEPIDMRDVVQDSVKLNVPAAQQKGLVLKAELPADPCMVRADHDRMREALNNLVGNAIKFTPQGGKIDVAVLDKEDVCELRVSDTGVGIPEKYLESIFDKFRSIPGRETSLSTGLGLSIVKGIVEAHGGRVWVESKPDEGSTFFIHIPKIKS